MRMHLMFSVRSARLSRLDWGLVSVSSTPTVSRGFTITGSVGGNIVTVSYLDRTMYLLGYIPQDNTLGDKNLNVVR